MTEPAPEVLAVIEEALVRHRAFGDSAYILGQLEVAFTRRLERVAQAVAPAGELLQSFRAADATTRYRLAGNTVVRCAVQHAYTQLETGKQVGLDLPQCEEVIRATQQHLAGGGTGSPYENGPVALQRLGDAWFHGWVWSDAYPDDVFGRAFRQILELEYGGQLCSIDDEELAMLRLGEALLRELLPDLAVSALTHAHQVGCFPDSGYWKGKVSSSQIRMGGTIFLNRQMLRNPWCTAEHLLHESLHQKLYDFRHGHSLLDVDAPLENAPRVVSLWNAQEFNRANHWDTHRAFAAFHVYAQLALLATVAERRAPELEARYGRFCGMVESRKALDRARYLGEQLQEQCATHLGPAGLRMRDWLMTVLDHLDPAPPPRGAYVHLMLDLYVREANRIESVIAHQEGAVAAFAGHLVPAAQAEIAAARRILGALGATPELAQLDRDLDAQVGTGFARGFPRVRRLVAGALLQAAPDGYGLNARAPAGYDADLEVRRLVERGSDSLYLMQANVPRAVAGAKRRAKEMRCGASSDDDTGRLLAVLAAAVPRGGRILELDAGVGVGLAWIVTGVGARTDVEVVAIEEDRRMADSARTHDWPQGVRILAGDARELLPTRGCFALVSASAAAAAACGVDALVDVLAPGGLLVVDARGAVSSAEGEDWRLALLRHPGLLGAPLDGAGRVLLLARRAELAEFSATAASAASAAPEPVAAVPA